MATTYYEDSTASDVSLGGSFSHVLTQTQPGATSSDSLSAGSGGGTAVGYYISLASDPGASGTGTGSFTCRLNITTTVSSVTWAFSLLRINAAGAIQASSAFSSETTCAILGVSLATLTNPSLGTFAAGDRLAVEIRITNSNSHGGAKGPTWEVGGASDFLAAPWSAGVTSNDSGSGTISLSGSGVGSYTLSDSGSGTISFSGSGVDNFVPPSTAYNDVGSGTITLSGSSIDAVTYADSDQGVITLSGSSIEGGTHSATASGAITFSGSGVESYQPPGATYTDSGVGTITLSGASTESSSRNSTGTGSVTLSGPRAESAGFVSSAVGSITLSGSGVETFIGPVVNADSGLGSIFLSGSSTETYTWGGGASLKPFLLMHHSGLARLENIRQWLTTNTSYAPHNGSLREIESWLWANPIGGKECTPYDKAGTDEFWAIEEFLLEISGSGG